MSMASSVDMATARLSLSHDNSYMSRVCQVILAYSFVIYDFIAVLEVSTMSVKTVAVVKIFNYHIVIFS